MLLRYHGRQYREAYIRKDLSWLKSYLSMSPEQEAAELAWKFPEVFARWLWEDFHWRPELYDETPFVTSRMTEEEDDLVDVIDYDGEEAKYWLTQLPAHKQQVFRDKGGFAASDMYPVEAPSFLYFNTPELIKNQWLIHFTKDDAQAIQADGFTKGVDDLTTLGLTTHIYEEDKPGGYNFAYHLGDFLRYGSSHYGGWKYGKSAVMFRASGLRMWHSGDEEPQVIFWGADAKDIVVLAQHGENWMVDSCKPIERDDVYAAEDLEAVVDWVVDNFQQYRKVLVCR